MAKHADPWQELLQEGGRAEVVEQLPQKRWRRWVTGYMWFAVVCLPAIVLIATLAVGSINNGLLNLQDRLDNQHVSATSPGRAAATLTVEGWLKKTPQPIPGGKIVSWDGATNVPLVKREVEGNDRTEETRFVSEINTFTVSDAQNNLWSVAVGVKVDPRDNTAKTIGEPFMALKVGVNADGWDDGSAWPGVAADLTVVTEETRTAVQTWAEAYTSGDSKRLGVAVGDPDPTHLYMPIYPAKKITATIDDAAPKQMGDNSSIVATITLVLDWEDSKQPAAADNKNSVTSQMDVLITGANTTSPKIVAWGPVGSGFTLAPYSNATSGEAAVNLETPTPAPSPSPSPTGK